ncbi:MAG: hypothetical protein IPK52_05460 [Chloroflexi bacterium]|nr:hypothetical protein [Chloroflexota bacterium]
MGLRRTPASNWLWTVVALMLVLVVLSPIPAQARQYRTTSRISVSSTGVQGINIQHPVINGDGLRVAFWSDKEGLVPGDTNFAGDVFVRDIATNRTLRLSLGHMGVQTARTDGNLPISYPDIDIDDNGCLIAYSSDAMNITQQNGTATADVNNTTDVFVVDWCTAPFPSNPLQTIHVSKNYATGQQANGGNTNPKISGNGQFVLFRSSANNLVVGDTNNMPDIFIMDRTVAGFPISRVNLANNESQANMEDGTNTFSPSDNGMVVAFASIASNLLDTADGNGHADIFIRDRLLGTTIRINGIGGAAPNGPSFNPHISGNGTFVAFRSNASNLVPNDTNGKDDIFVYEIGTGAIERVSISSEGNQPTESSDHANITDNGRFVSFYSDAPNLVFGDTNGSGDIFVHDRTTHITTRASVRTNGSQASGPSNVYSALSDSGGLIAFDSYSTNIVDGDTNSTSDVFHGKSGPNSPNNLAVVSKGTTNISLSWDDNSGNEVNMVVQRRLQASADFSDRQTLGVNAEAFNDTALVACTVYLYRIMSVDSDGIRSPSNILKVKTLGCPPGPFSLSRPVGNESVINPVRAEFRWAPSEEAVDFTFTLTRTSAPAGVAENRVVTAASVCNTARCEIPVDAGLLADLINGSYSWTVTATNPYGTTPASNNPQTFVVNDMLEPRDFPIYGPADGGLVRTVDNLPPFTWYDSKDAEFYSLNVIQISNNVRLGSVIDRPTLTPVADADGLACDFNNRVCYYTPTAGEKALMSDGTYTWTVAAISPGGTPHESSNGAFVYVLNTGDIEILKNGGFEDDTNVDGLADFWTVTNGTTDSRKCNTLSKTFTTFGSCAFMFVGAAGESSILKQSLTDEGYGMKAGDQVHFSAQSQAQSVSGGLVKIIVKIKYVGGVFSTDKATIAVPGGSYGWNPTATANLTVDGPVKKIDISVTSTATVGKMTFDELSLLLLGLDSPRRRSAEGTVFGEGSRIPLDGSSPDMGQLLPPPPPPVEGFRGQN